MLDIGADRCCVLFHLLVLTRLLRGIRLKHRTPNAVQARPQLPHSYASTTATTLTSAELSANRAEQFHSGSTLFVRAKLIISHPFRPFRSASTALRQRFESCSGSWMYCFLRTGKNRALTTEQTKDQRAVQEKSSIVLATTSEHIRFYCGQRPTAVRDANSRRSRTARERKGFEVVVEHFRGKSRKGPARMCRRIP